MLTKSFHQVDIIEGTNDFGTNQISLHTTANCTMAENRTMTGYSITQDCWNQTDFNAGCGVKSTEANSYGPAFNSAGGGWYVFERALSGLSVWFWSREVSSNTRINSKGYQLTYMTPSPTVGPQCAFSRAVWRAKHLVSFIRDACRILPINHELQHPLTLRTK